eukprot:4581493-Prymnesium_polylepis.2
MKPSRARCSSSSSTCCRRATRPAARQMTPWAAARSGKCARRCSSGGKSRGCRPPGAPDGSRRRRWRCGC